MPSLPSGTPLVSSSPTWNHPRHAGPAERHARSGASPAPAGRRMPLPPARAGTRSSIWTPWPTIRNTPDPSQAVPMACDAACRSASDRRGSTSADTSTSGTSATGGSSSELGTDPRCHTGRIPAVLDLVLRLTRESTTSGRWRLPREGGNAPCGDSGDTGVLSVWQSRWQRWRWWHSQRGGSKGPQPGRVHPDADPWASSTSAIWASTSHPTRMRSAPTASTTTSTSARTSRPTPSARHRRRDSRRHRTTASWFPPSSRRRTCRSAARSTRRVK